MAKRAKRQVLQIRPRRMSWEDAMEMYLRFRAAEGLRGATLTDYRQKIRQFFKTFPDSWPNCMEEPLLEWLAATKSPATYNLRLGALRLFLDWTVEKQLVPSNPVAGFRMRKKSDRIVDIPEDVMRQLLTLPDRKSYVGLRDYALFTLFLDTGIRPSECFKLVPGDFNFRTRTLTVRAEVSKTGQPRGLPLSDVTIRALEEFLAVRPPEWTAPDVVFTSVYGRPLTKDTWGDIMEKYSKRLGTKVIPYDLRHMFALMFLRRGGNAFALQRIMGHESMEMTRRYVNLVQSDLKAMHRAASPVDGLVPPKRQKVDTRLRL